MSFWLNDNKFVVYARQTRFRYRFLLSLLLFSTIFSVWGFVFYLPAKNKISQLNPIISDLRRQSANFENVIKAFNKEQTLSEDLRIKFEQFSDLTIDNKSFSDFLIKMLSKHNISCSGVSPLFNKANQCFFKNYFHVTFKCRYADFCEFCNDADVLPKPLKFCYLKIVRWKDGKIKADAVFRNISVVNS